MGRDLGPGPSAHPPALHLALRLRGLHVAGGDPGDPGVHAHAGALVGDARFLGRAAQPKLPSGAGFADRDLPASGRWLPGVCRAAGEGRAGPRAIGALAGGVPGRGCRGGAGLVPVVAAGRATRRPGGGFQRCRRHLARDEANGVAGPGRACPVAGPLVVRAAPAALAPLAHRGGDAARCVYLSRRLRAGAGGCAQAVPHPRLDVLQRHSRRPGAPAERTRGPGDVGLGVAGGRGRKPRGRGGDLPHPVRVVSHAGWLQLHPREAGHGRSRPHRGPDHADAL